jgi:hypothetical protein
MVQRRHKTEYVYDDDYGAIRNRESTGIVSAADLFCPHDNGRRHAVHDHHLTTKMSGFT